MKKIFIYVVMFVLSTLTVPLCTNYFNKINTYGHADVLGTPVGGRITESTTWTLDGSPYVVIENVIVEPNVTLLIKPGVVINFAKGTELIIDGALIAQGNATHKIIFTSNSTIPQPGYWGGIRFRDRSDDTRCLIEWAIVQYANFGVFSESASPKIRNSIVRWNLYAGIDGFKSGFSIINSTITENVGTGISGHGDQTNVMWEILNSNISLNGGYGVDIYLYMYSSATLDNNYVSNNGLTGISIYVAPSMHSCSATISNNKVLNNGKNGLLFGAKPYPFEGGIYANIGLYSSLLILNNTVSNNKGAGIFVDMDYSTGSNINLSKNIISNNNGTGVHLEWNYDPPASFVASDLIVTFNNQSGVVSNIGPIRRSKIFSNSPYNFVVTDSRDIDAKYNWWGTINETLIKESIYDYCDDYNLGRVLYKPYLVPPIADFTYSPETPYAFGTTIFDASASFNPYGRIMSYTWDFGDGNVTITTSPIITHVYTMPNIYNVNLTVTDEFGLTNSIVTILAVLEDKIAPTIFEVKRFPEGDVKPSEAVKVMVNVTDTMSGVKDVILSYRVGDGFLWTNVSMSFNGTSGFYEVSIRIQQENVVVEYKLIVYDNAGNYIIDDNNGQHYSFIIIPEFSSVTFLLIFLAFSMMLMSLKLKNY